MCVLCVCVFLVVWCAIAFVCDVVLVCLCVVVCVCRVFAGFASVFVFPKGSDLESDVFMCVRCVRLARP